MFYFIYANGNFTNTLPCQVRIAIAQSIVDGSKNAGQPPVFTAPPLSVGTEPKLDPKLKWFNI